MPNPVSSAWRLLVAGFVLAHHDALLPREAAHLAPAPARLPAAVLRTFSPAARRPRGRPGERLARAFEALGPAAIKLGQLLSTRADIFGEAFVADLSRLKDRLPPFPTDEAQGRGRAHPRSARSTPCSPASSPPVAAASLAQAHPALLHDGRRVAVKVLRPGVERRVAADIGALLLGGAPGRALRRPAAPAGADKPSPRPSPARWSWSWTCA